MLLVFFDSDGIIHVIHKKILQYGSTVTTLFYRDIMKCIYLVQPQYGIKTLTRSATIQ